MSSVRVSKNLNHSIKFKNNLKKASLLVPVLSLAACGGGDGGGDPTATPAPPAPTAPTPTPTPNPTPTPATFNLVGVNTYVASNSNGGSFNQSGSSADLTVSGGHGDDNITTGTGDDIVYGEGGDDIIRTGSGDDIVRGDEGADNMDGGTGVDWLTYINATSGVNVNLATGVGSGGEASGDVFANFENVSGSNHNDVLIGNSGTNVLDGDGGADTIDGGAGIDFVSFLTATAGVDVDLLSGTGSRNDAAGDTYSNIESVFGSAFDDTISGDNEDNQLVGFNGDDTLNGNGGDDLLEGGIGDDTLNGNDGDDLLRGGSGSDVLDGGGNDERGDTISYSTSTSGITIDLGAGTASGGDATGDTFSNIENVDGSDHADNITGDDNANIIDGWKGVDTINGAGGDDLILAFQIDSGEDNIIDGGAGIDTIEFFRSISETEYDIDLSNVNATNIEFISLSDSITALDLAEELTLTAQDVLDVTDGNNQLIIEGQSEDSVISAGQGWVQGGDQVIDGETYETYTSGTATLLVDEDINLTIS